jgi:hypothetical protein
MYIFADMRGIPALKNAIIDVMVEASDKELCIPIESMKIIWETAPESARLQNLVLN